MGGGYQADAAYWGFSGVEESRQVQRGVGAVVAGFVGGGEEGEINSPLQEQIRRAGGASPAPTHTKSGRTEVRPYKGESRFADGRAVCAMEMVSDNLPENGPSD